jgi:hypothetical protein
MSQPRCPGPPTYGAEGRRAQSRGPSTVTATSGPSAWRSRNLEGAAARETAHPLQPFRGHQCGERLALARDDERVVTERDPIEQIADTL